VLILDNLADNRISVQTYDGRVTAKTTGNERVYLAIRWEILAGQRRPGEPLKTAELSKRFESSVGVVRESLLRLAEHGLVQVRPMQGFRVPELTADDLQDLTEARLDIETLALRYSVTQGDAAWESQLVGAHHLLTVTPRRDDSGERYTPDWGKAHGAFHVALIAGCRNRRIFGIANRLRDTAELYRRWSVGEDRDTAAEHKALLDAALARDAELAVDLLATQIRTTHDVLSKNL
jgi:DNA-binding GntR family transcriptional regulator